MKTYKGYYKPKFPSKYDGDINGIVYRSRLELRLFIWIDTHPQTIKWKSEEFFIPYISPKDNKLHRYFPDVLLERKDKEGKIATFVIEIKPDSQSKPPKANIQTIKAKKRFIRESITYAINQAKWEAADKYCKKQGWKFVVMGEKAYKSLGIIQ